VRGLDDSIATPPRSNHPDIAAVIFDLDGVLIDSENVWDDARRALVAHYGGTWLPTSTRDMMGMSSREWAAYLRDRLGVPLAADRVSSEVAAAVVVRYSRHLPLLHGAVDAVRRIAVEFPLGLASSSNRTVIDAVLDAAGLRSSFTVVISSEEVARGKPAPDVYLAAADALGVAPQRCVAIEDSSNGIRAGAAAAMAVIAIPNAHFPPESDALALARRVVLSLDELTVARIRSIALRQSSGEHSVEEGIEGDHVDAAGVDVVPFVGNDVVDDVARPRRGRPLRGDRRALRRRLHERILRAVREERGWARR
jgi:beta-phosphoglucomutase-like phosphatase (HAD superfamily)